MLDWNDLRYFLEVSRSGSLTRAAETLEVDQTTVGRRIAALERALDTRLFRREPTGYALTPSGKKLLGHAQSIAERAEALARELRGDDRRLRGTVTLATTEALAQHFLIPRLGGLFRRHPELDVTVLTSNRSVDLARGQADLAIHVSRPTDKALIARKIGDSERGLFAAASYLEKKGVPDPGALQGHDFLGFEGELAESPEAHWLRGQVPQPRIVLRTNSMPGLLTAAAAGLGAAILPVPLAERHANLVCIAPIPEVGAREVWLSSHRDLRKNARVRAVFDYLLEQWADREREREQKRRRS